MSGIIRNPCTNPVRGAAYVCGVIGAPHKRRFLSTRRIQSTKKEQSNIQKTHSSPSQTTNKVRHAVPALLGGTALAAAPLIFPAPVFSAPPVEQQFTPAITTAVAAPQFQHAYHMVDDHTMCMGCMALGSTFSILTLACTGRFILSFFPNLERAARQSQGPLLLRAFVMLDGLLGPTQRGIFSMKEEGDVNYAAMLYLALMSGVLEVLFGPNGILFHSVPDIGILKFLDYLIMWQQMLLLPQWTMAVFRYFMLI